MKDCIYRVVEDLNGKGAFIKNASSIIKTIEEKEGIDVKHHQVCKIMRQDLNMSYSRVKAISWQQNSDKNLILR